MGLKSFVIVIFALSDLNLKLCELADYFDGCRAITKADDYLRDVKTQFVIKPPMFTIGSELNPVFQFIFVLQKIL